MRDLLAPLSRRDIALLLALAAVFVGFTLFAEGQMPQSESRWPALSVHSNEPEGSRALSLWLRELGYRTDALEFRPFQLDSSAGLLFLLAPSIELKASQVEELRGWVERGGVLVVAAEHPNPLLEQLGVAVAQRSVRPRGPASSPLDLLLPREPAPAPPPVAAIARRSPMADPPLRRVEAGYFAMLTPSQPGWVTLLERGQEGGDVVAAVSTVGKGRVFALASFDPLSNGYLGKADNWALVLQMLGDVPSGSLLLFDEYHHGFTESGTLNAHLLSDPWGWAVLYGGVLLFVYLALAGRRFGRVLVPATFGAKRQRAEYAATMAGLLRHGGHQQWLCGQFAAQLKRSLASRYRVPADLPAARFVSTLAAEKPEAAGLAGPLERLERADLGDEAAVLGLIREAEALRLRLLS